MQKMELLMKILNLLVLQGYNHQNDIDFYNKKTNATENAALASLEEYT